MRIDKEKFIENICKNCKRFAGEKPALGKCSGDMMHSCARILLLQGEIFEEYTGIKGGK